MFVAWYVDKLIHVKLQWRMDSRIYTRWHFEEMHDIMFGARHHVLDHQILQITLYIYSLLDSAINGDHPPNVDNSDKGLTDLPGYSDNGLTDHPGYSDKGLTEHPGYSDKGLTEHPMCILKRV